MYYFLKDDKLHSFFEKLLQLFFPMGTYCICCGKYIDLTRTYLICDQCMSSINWGHICIDLEQERKKSGRTKYLDSVLSCMVYGMHSKRLVFDLKYNKKTFLARPISYIMADRLLTDDTLGDLLNRIDYVIPIPLNQKRQKKRGFNQAALIASGLTDRLNASLKGHNILFLEKALKRDKPTIEQRSVNGGQRFSNLEGAFSLSPIYLPRIADSVILLIDDIFTTGATADRCARILKDAGAKEVHFLSLATGNYYLMGASRPRNDEEFLSSID